MAKSNVEVFCRALWRHEDKTIAALAGRVDPNGPERWGHTPLLMAVKYGDLSLVSLLVGRGGDVDQRRKYLTPITLAAHRKAYDIVNFLRAEGATLSIATWLYLGDRQSIEQELVRDPMQSRLRDEEGTPILHHAVEHCNLSWSCCFSTAAPRFLKPTPTAKRRCIGAPTCAKHRKKPRLRWRLFFSIAAPMPTRATGTTANGKKSTH
jgi:ankyrin repeat protein